MRTHLPRRVLGASSPSDEHLTVSVAAFFSFSAMSFCQACGTKAFENAKYNVPSRPPYNCDVDIDWNYDLDAQTEFELGLMELYNRLGMSEHDVNVDIDSVFLFGAVTV